MRHNPRQPALMEWSYTRRATLERCLRWYYYQYYGANARTAKTEPYKETLRFLKTLRNRPLRTGEIVHLIVRTYLTRLQQGEVWSLERLLHWAQDISRRDVAYSKQYQRREQMPDGPYPPALLLEFYYGFEDPEALWEASATRLAVALTNFATHPGFAHFHAAGGRAGTLIEKRFSVRENHFSMRGQIDLAYPEDGRVVVADWKVGSSHGSDDSLQLLSYVLGVQQAFPCSPDKVDLYRVHLADNMLLPFVVGDKEMQRARARIIQDVEKMQALDHYGRNAVSQAFTPCGQPRVCALCPFQQICPKE